MENGPMVNEARNEEEINNFSDNFYFVAYAYLHSRYKYIN